jgi:hypothetical protein
MVDEYDQEEIMDYFKVIETSSLQVAQEEWQIAITPGNN